MRILVCGSNYGASYLGAIRLHGGHEIAALLARGSERSRQVAASFDVPLVTALDDAGAIDAACVAVGGDAGQELSVALLERGVPVLREHPIGPSRLEELFSAASRGNTHVHVNGHYADFAPCSEFVAHSRSLRRASQPVLIQVSADLQFLWAILDVVGAAMGSTEFRFGEPAVQALPIDASLQFATCSGDLAGIPLVLTYGLNWGKEDDRSMAFLGDEVSLDFLRGRLCLVGIDGLVLMHRNVWALQTGCAVPPYLERLHVGDGHAVEVLSGPPPSDLECVRRRFVANAAAIDRLLAHRSGEEGPLTQAPAYLLGLSRAWTHLTRGRAHEADARPHIVAEASPPCTPDEPS